MKIAPSGLLALYAVAALIHAPAAHAEEPAGAYSMSGQVAAVYRIGSAQTGTLQVIRSEFGGALPFDASASDRAEETLRRSGADAVRMALASGAVEGRADSIAIIYRLGGDPAGAAGSPFAPVAMFHCETRFSVDAAGAAHVAQSIRIAPIDANAAPTDASPAPRLFERPRDASPDFVPQPLPER